MLNIVVILNIGISQNRQKKITRAKTLVIIKLN